METCAKIGAAFRELGDLRLYRNPANIFFLVFPNGNSKVFADEDIAIREMNYAFYRGIELNNKSLIINEKAES